MKPTEENLKKTTSYLNDLRTLITLGKGTIHHTDRKRIHDKYKLPYSFFATAKEIGYFHKLTHDKFSCAQLVPFDPIHARNLINKHDERRLKKLTEKHLAQTTVSVTPIPTPKKHKAIPKPSKKPETKPTYAPTKKENKLKTFSIFWGLLKFNY